MKKYCLLIVTIGMISALCAMEKEPRVHFGTTPSLPESERPRVLHGVELESTREAEGHKPRTRGAPGSRKKPKYTKSGLFTPEELEQYLARTPQPVSEKVLREADLEIAQIEANPLGDLPDIAQTADARLREIGSQYPDIELYGDQEGFDQMSAQLAQLRTMLEGYIQEIKKRIAAWKEKLAVPQISDETKQLLRQQLLVMQDKKRIVEQRLKTVTSYENQIAKDRGQKASTTELA